MIDPQTDHDIKKYFLTHCFLGIVYNPNTNWSSDFVKNAALCATEYMMIDARLTALKFSIVQDLQSALCAAKKHDRKYLIYSEIGNVFKLDPIFNNHLSKFVCNNNLKFAGHILDYGNDSFCIHPQFFIIDVDWAFKNKIFSIADQDQTVEWEGRVIERSKENYHDHYTPIWVKGTQTVKKFKGRGRGWNILDKLAETGENFLPWNEEIRNAKWFMYPTVKQEATRIKSMVMSTCKHDGIYIANTENIERDDIQPIIKKYKNLEIMATPASGITTMVFPYKYNVKKIIWYDSSDDAIEFGHDLIKWDGRNYKDYVLAKNYKFAKGSHYLDYVNKEINNLGEDFVEWWNNVKYNVTIIPTNIFDMQTYNKFVDHLYDAPTLINISNIMHYYPDQCIFRSHEKAEMLLEFQNRCLKKVSKENLNFYGMNPYRRYRIAGLATQEDLTNPEFESLPWRNE